MSDAQEFRPPSPEILTFLIPISLQALLLHPIFPAALSRPLRFLLAPFSIYLTWFSSFDHGFEPRESSVGINFVLGVMNAYGVWKALEWGTAADLTPYTWVGFVETEEGKAVGPKESKEDLEAIRRNQAEKDGPLDIISWTILLLGSMRGNGWAFGPPPRSLAPHPPRQLLAFLRSTLFEITWSHLSLVSCAVVLLARQPSRMVFFSTLFPSLPDSTLRILSEAVATMALGTGAFAGLTLGMQIAILVVFVPTELLRLLPLPTALKPNPFDARQYPPLFLRPWAPENVSHFWSQQWHSFFSLPFAYLGFGPFSKVGEAVGGKAGGRALGVLAVFAMSAWLHEHAIWSATHTLPPPSIPLDFPTRWGGSIYFMAQGVAIILEGAWRAITGKKVQGPLAFIWSVCCMAGLGYYTYLAWSTLGLFNNLPHPAEWTWARWLIPMAAVSPPQAFA
ncbi:hypothetical protein BCR35DRAFT_300604 [Leucosporidium creatinivorum]|uniref:Wax synthase domain-containing protein n=1 Tax=Leucosporidium creatinivorum TaxID=106004 RepID=A0A1Y2FZ60_9BASI|nr:hypothetical protein BCR35DRAFT_300604 [Leucosporidium creatinivorum]